MEKNKLNLKDTFVTALESYKKKEFTMAENVCNKILSIDPSHFDSLVLLSNIFAINKNFSKAKELLSKANKVVELTKLYNFLNKK